MSELPNTWMQESMGALVVLNEKIRNIEVDVDCGFVPMNLVPTKLLGKIQYEQKKWGDCKNGYTHFKDGDVLLAKITPCFENGKSVLVSGLPNGIGTGSTEYFVLRSELLDSRYLHAFVKTKQFKDDCTVRMTGSVGHKRVPKDYLLEYLIPVAPLNEQIRIANKLDSVLAKVDATQARLEKIPTLLKRFRQSVLAAATSGELTREWREENLPFGQDNSANEVIQRIQDKKLAWINENSQHNEVSRVKKRVHAFLANSRIETTCLPDSWVWAKLEDVVLMVVDCHNKTAPYEDSGIELVRTTNIRDGRFIWEDIRYISEATYQYWSKRCLPEPGDVIFTREAPMGEAAIIPVGAKICLGQRTMLFRPIEDQLSAKFLLIVLMDPSFRERSENIAVGTGVKHYRVGDVSELNIPVPSSDEQTEIVRRVESLFALADTVEKQYLAAKQRLDRLSQSILAKAFRGELVPQDPNDEPAAELLKRIQAERQAQPPANRKRSKPA